MGQQGNTWDYTTDPPAPGASQGDSSLFGKPHLRDKTAQAKGAQGQNNSPGVRGDGQGTGQAGTYRAGPGALPALARANGGPLWDGAQERCSGKVCGATRGPGARVQDRRDFPFDTSTGMTRAT